MALNVVVLYNWGGANSSPKDESNKLMNTNDGKMFKNCKSILIYLVSCFVFLFTIVVLTTNATILSIKMVSYK